MPQPTDEPSPPATPKQLVVGELVGTAADRLQLRNAPGLAAASQGVLPSGTVGVLVEGPVEADGHAWYRIGHVGLPWGSGCATGPDDDGYLRYCWDEGWVAGAGSDGSAWLVPAEVDCPAAPSTVAALAEIPPGIAQGCFGAADLVVTGYISPLPGGRGCYPGYGQVPEWLGLCAISFLQAIESEVESEGPEMAVHLHPDVGRCDFGGHTPATCPFVPFIGRWVAVTGHFNDPASESCDIQPWEGNEHAPDDALGRHLCRQRFVVTAISPGSAP